MYTFLQKQHEKLNGITMYAAISEDRIEEFDLYTAYGQYGQQIGHNSAGDCLEILTDAAAQKANDAWNEMYGDEDVFETRYKVGDIVSGDDSLFDTLVDQEGVNLSIWTAKGFTYWDGHNHKTIILSSDNPGFEGDWSIVEDEELIEELQEAIENMELIGTCQGVTSYKSEDGKWGIDDSAWQGTWSKYDIRLMEDVETLANYPEYM